MKMTMKKITKDKNKQNDDKAKSQTKEAEDKD